ncbi:hypothetical protein CVT26_006524 [Gymnopilus dilepis]|uniref:Uncharacterized protein n=1 Tax=Gymnopilus dilepis TaxID=231916 RepID=A0A409X107_9AGAR|nr:hypothetical protein CVT26_006524 [Gymnopilus dilepis]
MPQTRHRQHSQATEPPRTPSTARSSSTSSLTATSPPSTPSTTGSDIEIVTTTVTVTTRTRRRHRSPSRSQNAQIETVTTTRVAPRAHTPAVRGSEDEGYLSSPSPAVRTRVERPQASPTPQRTTRGGPSADGSDVRQSQVPRLLIHPSTLLRSSLLTSTPDGAAAGPSRRPRRTMKVYVAPKPKDLVKIPGHILLYILTGGGGGGIYPNESTPNQLSEKCGWKVVQHRFRWEKALDLYTAAWESGTILIEPNDDSNHPFVEIELPDQDLPLPTLPPAPETIIRPVKTGKYYYVVYVGEDMGIFGSWHDAAIRIRRVDGYCVKYEQYDQAYAAYVSLVANGGYTLKPVRHGLFDPGVADRLRAATKGIII